MPGTGIPLDVTRTDLEDVGATGTRISVDGVCGSCCSNDAKAADVDAVVWIEGAGG